VAMDAVASRGAARGGLYNTGCDRGLSVHARSHCTVEPTTSSAAHQLEQGRDPPNRHPLPRPQPPPSTWDRGRRRDALLVLDAPPTVQRQQWPARTGQDSTAPHRTAQDETSGRVAARTGRNRIESKKTTCIRPALVRLPARGPGRRFAVDDWPVAPSAVRHCAL
jgi:hypothetical protein